MKYGSVLIPTKDETLEFQVFKRLSNTAYEYEDKPSITFRGKFANDLEKNQYRIQMGINGNQDSLFIYSSNMPIEDLKVGDMVLVMGEKRYIQSVGYYYTQNKITNLSLFSDKYIIQKSPKGLNIQ